MRRQNSPRAQRSESVGGGAQAEINHLSSMLLPFGALGGVWSEAAAGTSPTETLGGWGFLHPSKQLCLPRGQHQQYPIHYKEYRRREGENNKRKRNNKHLFAVIIQVVFFSDLKELNESCGKLIMSGIDQFNNYFNVEIQS